MTLKSHLLRFRKLVLCNGAEIDHVFLLNVNRESYMGSITAPSHLTFGDLERSMSKSQKLVTEDYIVHILHIFAINIVTWVSHKRICRFAGFSSVSPVFLVLVLDLMLIANFNIRKPLTLLKRLLRLLFCYQLKLSVNQLPVSKYDK